MSGKVAEEPPSENNNPPDEVLATASYSNSSSNFTDKSQHLLTDEDFSSDAFSDIDVDNVRIKEKSLNLNNQSREFKDALKKLRATRMSPEIRRLLRNMLNSDYAAEIIFLANKAVKEHPCVQIRPMAPLFYTFPNTAKNSLFATRAINRGEFIIAPFPALLSTPEECGRTTIGQLMSNVILFSGLQSDYINYQDIGELVGSLPEGEGRKRRRSTGMFFQRKKMRVEQGEVVPVDKYCSDDEATQCSAYDKLDICIDITDSTEEIKAIRRNCTPNCAIRYVLLHQRMELFICARCDIEEGEELTLPHDYDANFSNKVIQCAHSYKPRELCIYERERQETIRRYVGMDMEAEFGLQGSDAAPDAPSASENPQ